MKPYMRDFSVLPAADLSEVDERVRAEADRVKVPDLVAKMLAAGMLWALYERMGKPVWSNLKALAAARITREHVLGKVRPGGALAAVENIGDVLPFKRPGRDAFRFATLHAGDGLRGVTDKTRAAVRSILVQAKMDGTHPKALAEKLRLTFKGLDRDWRRVAVTESASIATNGYVLSQGEGQKLIGISRPNCCSWCRDVIAGKIFTVTHHPPENPEAPENRYLIWPGKANHGRVRHAKDNSGRVRNASELWLPCAPLHSSCFCRYASFDPRFHEVGTDGLMKLRGLS